MSPLDQPGRGQFLAWVRLSEGDPNLLALAVHGDVYRLCLPHLQPGPMANSLPGHWTGHVTLARRVAPARLGRALRSAGKPSEIIGRVIGLRRWDGNSKREYPIG